MPESVYISSTYQDLKIFRQAIINCVVSLVDYYKPVSMEFYDAEDVHFVQKCEQDVEACNIYILILGKRYGYIPKGFTKSITELEYEKAIECKKNGKQIEILVFKVGDFCKNYNYDENDSKFTEYQQDFLDEVQERLSPKPFESEAELQLQVSYALMKRLFKLITTGEKIILPDKDAVLCYCDRQPVINGMMLNILQFQKKIFFIQGNKMKDYPGGIVKRFAKYSLGSFNKIEPQLDITKLSASCDSENSNSGIIYSILQYINRPPTLENIAIEGFVKELGLLKSSKVVLPFYYDSFFDTESNKFADFLCFLNALFNEYKIQNPQYELYAIMLIYSEQPDKKSIKENLGKFSLLNNISATIDKLGPVSKYEVLDWIEAFVTGTEYSPSVYHEYFGTQNEQYTMQEVNIKLGEIIDDLGKGNEKIKKFL